jgi:hypothetical protein
MSFTALAMVLFHLAMFGAAPQGDEGTEAHIWQLLMIGQIPLLVVHAFKWPRKNPKEALQVIGIQLGAALVAVAPVYLLRW